ncbi:MAG: ABC transporter ATP-binding protein [Chloroflexi bacterium]|nr:ABC transporter ATP-binding protein [Chloroflexota bacterium]
MSDEKKLCLSGKGVTKVFGLGRNKTVAVDHVDFNFYEGEIISIVGESGSGKTTLAKMLLGLINPTEGDIYFQGELMTEACSFVNLKFAELTNKYPFELSGGQQQRLMIARIFLLKPQILLADEPTSMIDACSRATILDMLMQLRDEIGMTPIFITHDIGLAYYVSDSVYIMEHGKFVESGSADQVILHPQEPYTKRLLNDVPKIYEEWDLSTV